MGIASGRLEMTESPQRTPLVLFALMAAIAAIGVAVVYAGRWRTGLYYDDYHFLRPAMSLDLRRVWFGSWDPSGIEAVFFRPLTAWLFAARFELFGLNSDALHFVSLAGHALCAVLIGWFVSRSLGAGAGVVAGWLYAIHPAMPYAQTSWLTNQMHLTESLLVVIALLAWQSARRGSRWWWLVVGAIAGLAFLVKEDAIMVLPAICGLDLIDRIAARRAPDRTWYLVTGASLVLVLALVAFRFDRLGAIGGYGVPTPAQAWDNVLKGPLAAIVLLPGRNPWRAVSASIAIALLIVALVRSRAWTSRPPVFAAGVVVVVALGSQLPSFLLPRADGYPLWTIQGIASGAALGLLLLGAGVGWWRKDWPVVAAIGMGAAVVAAFDLPFALVSKREQFHLIALGSVLMSAGAIEALRRSGGTGARRAMIIAGCVVATTPSVLLTRSETLDFAPCAPNVVEIDQGVRDWWVVPDELKAWLEKKTASCRAGQPVTPLSSLDLVTWGVFDPPAGPDPDRVRWTSDTAVFALSPRITSARLFLRRTDASAAHPVRVTIDGDTTRQHFVLASPDWLLVPVAPAGTVLSLLRGRRHIDLTVQDWFVPAVVDPQAGDLRRHGVEFRLQ
jgi:hypothetical protein